MTRKIKNTFENASASELMPTTLNPINTPQPDKLDQIRAAIAQFEAGASATDTLYRIKGIIGDGGPVAI
jgi:hypothetical protein